MTSVRRSALCIDFPLKLALECKTRLFVEAVDLFVIHMDAFSLLHHMDTAVSKPFPVRCYRLHRLRNLFLLGIVPGLVTLRVARYPNPPASSAFVDMKVSHAARFVTDFTSSLRLAFSALSCFSLLTSETFMSPYLRFQL